MGAFLGYDRVDILLDLKKRSMQTGLAAAAGRMSTKKEERFMDWCIFCLIY